MPQVITNTLETLVERWDDPGDYPNNVASGPLPSYDYIGGMEGELVVELNEEEMNEWNSLENNDSAIQDFIEQTVDPKLPSGIKHVLRWEYTIKGNVLTIWAEIVEADIGEINDEPDYEPDYD